MKCPKCGGKTDVKDSRPYYSGMIVRRRLCRKCGLKFWTKEILFIEKNEEEENEMYRKIED